MNIICHIMRTGRIGEKLEIKNSVVLNSVTNYLIYFLTFTSITTVTTFCTVCAVQNQCFKISRKS